MTTSHDATNETFAQTSPKVTLPRDLSLRSRNDDEDGRPTTEITRARQRVTRDRIPRHDMATNSAIARTRAPLASHPRASERRGTMSLKEASGARGTSRDVARGTRSRASGTTTMTMTTDAIRVRVRGRTIDEREGVGLREHTLERTMVRGKTRERMKTVAASAASAASGFGGSASAPNGSRAPNAMDKFMQGMKDRLASDPNFFFKLGAEITIDEFITLFVNVAVRGNPLTWNVSEQLATACQMFTAAINDTLIVYFLAPTKASAGKKPEIASVFEKGDYTQAQRLMCFVNKAKFYAAIGAVSCTISMFLALTLAGNIAGFTHEVLFRSIITGGLHMGLSANTRYQIVNGIERVCYDVLPTNVAKSASVAVRMGNNFLGARLWMLTAQFTGLS